MKKKTDLKSLRNHAKTALNAASGKRLGSAVRAAQKREISRTTRVMTFREVTGF